MRPEDRYPGCESPKLTTEEAVRQLQDQVFRLSEKIRVTAEAVHQLRFERHTDAGRLEYAESILRRIERAFQGES